MNVFLFSAETSEEQSRMQWARAAPNVPPELGNATTTFVVSYSHTLRTLLTPNFPLDLGQN